MRYGDFGDRRAGEERFKLDYDVIVVGGGPVGCALARDIGAQGYRVLILEEHQEIGEPIRCAGLVSERTLKISRVSPKVVLNQLKGAFVHAPEKNILKLEGKRVYALVIDRAAFDRELADQARQAGANILCNTQAVKFAYVGDKVQVETTSEAGNNIFTCRLLIGADGHNSAVARWRNLPRPSEKVSMYAAEVSLPTGNSHLARIFLDRRLAPGWFGWLFPTGNNRARVGVGSSPSLAFEGTSNPRLLFERLVERFSSFFGGMEVLRVTSGVVPIGFLEKTYDAHVLLVGDAAAQVKPISGGGLYLGLKAAACCAATAGEALAKKDFRSDFLKAYQEAWRKAIGSEIQCGLRHREAFLGLQNEEIEFFLGFFDKPHWRKLILKYGDLDYHSWLAAKLSFIPAWASRFLNGAKATQRN